MRHGHARQISILLLTILTAFAVIPTASAEYDVLSEAVFFGDSTTAHMALRGGIPQERVWSGAGNTVLFETVNRTKCVHLHEENVDLTLAEAAALKKPRYLVITIGVSGGAGFLMEERFTAIYRELITAVQTASPDTRIFVQSILPLSHKSTAHFKKLSREAVAKANGWIAELCREMDIPFINTHDRLIDETGYLRILYQNDEYMHLTSAAYDVVRRQVREAIEQDHKNTTDKTMPQMRRNGGAYVR